MFSSKHSGKSFERKVKRILRNTRSPLDSKDVSTVVQYAFLDMYFSKFVPIRIKGGRKQISPMDTKLKQLYDAIRDYREPKANRQLALIFMKLPSKSVSIIDV